MIYFHTVNNDTVRHFMYVLFREVDVKMNYHMKVNSMTLVYLCVCMCVCVCGGGVWFRGRSGDQVR